VASLAVALELSCASGNEVGHETPSCRWKISGSGYCNSVCG